jgi:hypothetical protein
MFQRVFGRFGRKRFNGRSAAEEKQNISGIREGRRRKRLKRGIALIVSGMLFFQTVFAAAPEHIAQAASEAKPKVTLQSEEPITAGAKLRRLVWTSTRNGKKVTANANVIVVDLHHPYVKLDVMTGVGGQLTKRQSVRGMARETGAVAGVNGDYYNMKGEGAPIGPEIAGGEWISSPAKISGMYTFGITEDNEPVIDMYTFSGTITAANGATFPLAGINKSYYYMEPNYQHSHVNAIYMYTHAWGQIDRGNDGATTPTEVLVVDGVVENISVKQPLPLIPPKNGYILRADNIASKFILDNIRIGDPIQVEYALHPVDPKNTVDPSALKMLIGGHTILVDEGKPAKFSRDVSSLNGYRSRTGIGYSQDKRYVYLVTVDNSGDSQGMSLKEFQQFLTMIGVWKGINLDGGGSTQMVVRPLGETVAKLANKPEFGSERLVVNGVGVYTLAPPGKEVKGFSIIGPSVVFKREQAEFGVKGYDEYYNPITGPVASIRWSTNNGGFKGSTFIPAYEGKATVTAVSGSIKDSKVVEVVGRKQLTQMQIQSAESLLAAGMELELPVAVTTKSGLTRTLPAYLVDWELRGVTGTLKDGKLLVEKVGSDGYAQLIARYDGYSTMLALPVGTEAMWMDFEDPQVAVTFSGYPNGVQGSAATVTGLSGTEDGDRVLSIEYDFSAGEKMTKAAYAVFNGDQGVEVEGAPVRMKLDVHGDSSLNWLRAEVVDSAGTLHRVDLVKDINFSGWKTVSVDLSAYKMKYPIKIKRIYVASPEKDQEEREASGSIAVNNIVMQYQGKIPDPPKPELTMTLNKKELTFDGRKMTLDQPPIAVQGTTLVPLRFIAESLGGEVNWSRAEQKITLIKGAKLIEMWIGEKNINVNGKLVPALQAPTVKNGRTLVPLRFVSEHFGWKVDWDGKTKTIRLY